MKEGLVKRQDIIHSLNTIDRYVSEKLVLCDTNETFSQNEVFIVDDIYEAIEKLSIVAPIPKGHWRKIPMACYGGGTITEYQCSVCEENQITTSNFCPCCGADMREE